MFERWKRDSNIDLWRDLDQNRVYREAFNRVNVSYSISFFLFFLFQVEKLTAEPRDCVELGKIKSPLVLSISQISITC